MSTAMKPVIHVAPSIDYLFPATASTAKVYCGCLAKEVLESGEFIGVEGNLNPDCDVCGLCAQALRLSKRIPNEHPR